MESPNVATYRAGHEAFNERDFVAMTATRQHHLDRSLAGPDIHHAQEFKDDFLAGWIGASPDIRITGPVHRRWPDGGCTSPSPVRTRAARAVPRHGKQFTLPLCEMWHFDSSGQVVGGDLYYDQVSLLTQLGLMPQPS